MKKIRKIRKTFGKCLIFMGTYLILWIFTSELEAATLTDPNLTVNQSLKNTLAQQDRSDLAEDATRGSFVERLYEQGVENFLRNDYSGAIENLSRVIQYNTGLADAYYYLGRAVYETPYPWGVRHHFYDKAYIDWEAPIYDRVGIGRNPNNVQAFNLFGSAIARKEDFSEAYFHRSQIQFGRFINSFQRRLDDLNRAIEINQNYAEAYAQRGILIFDFFQLQNDNTQEEGGLSTNLLPLRDKAIEDLNRAISINPNLVDAYSGRGLIYFEFQDYQRAIEDFNRVIELDAGNVQAYRRIVDIHSRLGNHRDALNILSELIILEPENAEIHAEIGSLHAKLGDISQAIESYIKAVNLNPNINIDEQVEALPIDQKLAELYYVRGLAYLHALTNKEEESIETFNLTIRAREGFIDAYYQRGIAYYKLAQRNKEDELMAKAIEDFSYVTRAEPDHLTAYYLRGVSHSTLGNIQEALQDFTQATQIKPDFSGAYYQKGLIYQNTGDLEAAIQEFSKATTADSSFSEAYLQKGLTHYELGDYGPAINNYLKVIELNPWKDVDFSTKDNQLEISLEASYYKALAYLHLAQNSTEIDSNEYVSKGQGILTELIQKNPDLAVAYYYRGLSKTIRPVAPALASRFSLVRPTGSFSLLDELVSLSNTHATAAVQDFTQAITLRPDFAEAYLERGLVSAENYNFAEALSDFNTAIQINSEFAEAYLQRGRIYVRENPVDRAVEDYLSTSNSVAARIFAARFVEELGFLSEESDEEQISEFEALDRLLEEIFGEQRSRERNIEAGLADYSRAIQLQPDFAEAFYRRGVAQLYYGRDPRGAVEDFTRVISYEPDNPYAYHWRGDSHLELGNYQSAISDYNLALKIGYTEDWLGFFHEATSYAHASLGFAYYQLGDGERAQEEHSKAVSLFPCFFDISIRCRRGFVEAQLSEVERFFEQGVVLLRRGDRTGALEKFRRAAQLFLTQGNMTRYEATQYQISRIEN